MSTDDDTIIDLCCSLARSVYSDYIEGRISDTFVDLEG